MEIPPSDGKGHRSEQLRKLNSDNTQSTDKVEMSTMANSREGPNRFTYDPNPINNNADSLGRQNAENNASAVPTSGTSEVATLKIRVLWTCVVFYAHACMALMIGAIGPSFLDLISLVDSTVETGSFLFTAQAIGGVVGGLASAWFYTHFRKELLLTVNLFLCGALNILLPFCPVLWLMCVVIAVRGVVIYLSFTGCALICIEAWRKHEGSPILQALHCAYSAGGVIAPFIMSGFLQEEHCSGNSTSNSSTLLENVTLVDEMSGYRHDPPCGRSNAHWGFLIIGFTTLVNFTLSLVLMVCSKPTPAVENNTQETRETEYVVDPNSLDMGKKVIFLTFIVVYFMMIVAMETLMQNYLATFVVRHLGWTKADASRATSVFWGMFACGRFLGILTAKLLTPWRIIAVDFLLLSVSTISLVLAVDTHNAVLWVCVSSSGLFVSGLYAAGCSFVDENILSIDGKIYSIFLISETSGQIIYPLILGSLIDNISPMWFLYLAVIISVTCDLDFLILTMMEKRWGKQSKNRSEAVMEMIIAE